jgi:outer membrane receptor protein involved in Fe transport
MKLTFRQRLMASTLLIGTAALASPAWAQQTGTDETSEPAVQTTADPNAGDSDPGSGGTDASEQRSEIVITGSRIARRDLTSTSPLAVVQDEEFQLSGAVNVEQVMNTLPQVIPGSTGFDNNPGGGVSTLQLRGLGTTRTLVLVNGRRWMFFDTTQQVDLNTIPTFLLDSVDVVTGGASSVYGSDAVAGVVNFRLQNDLQGLMVGADYALTGQGDGRRYGGHMALGTSLPDGRGNVTAFAEYYNRADILAGQRDFSRFSTSQASGVDVCVDPSTIDKRRSNTGTVVGSIIQTGPNAGTCATGEPGFGRAGSSTTAGGIVRDLLGLYPGFSRAFIAPGVSRQRNSAIDQYNYAPDNYLMVPQKRWLVGGYGEYEISDAAKVFTEVTFVNNRVANELAPTPVTGFFDIDVAQACTFLSAADCTLFQTQAQRAGDPNVIESIFVQRRIIETGSRNQLDERNAFRALGGLRGNINNDWNYEAYYSQARTRNSQTQRGNISRSAFTAGLDGTGTPINIFGPGTLTSEQLDAITVDTQNSDISVLQVASASVSGTPFNFGMGGEDVGIAAGVEYRKVNSRFIPDFALSSGDVIGFNAGSPTAGGYDVKEAFGEIRLPIVGNQPFAHRLEVNFSGRASKYSLDAVGTVYTYAAGIEWAPIRDIGLRAQYQRAVRAPNVNDLFAGQAVGFPPATDPCAQEEAITNTAVRNICIATGVPAELLAFDADGEPLNAGIQINSQIESNFLGNPDLEEEKADTFTAGVVLRPSFIPGLNITVDGYDIEISDAISVLGGGVANTLRLCYNVIQDVNSIYCQAVNRDAGGILSGDEFVVTAPNANIGAFETRGVDLQVDYSRALGFGLLGNGRSRVNFFFLGTYVDQFDITPSQEFPDEVDECAGRFGISACGEPTPKWKWSSRLSWIDGPMTLTGRWRHVGAVKDDDDESFYTVERIKAVNYFDLAAAFNVNDNMTMTFGVNNLLDKQPQILGVNQEQSNTYPNTYDVLGRDFFVSANLRF